MAKNSSISNFKKKIFPGGWTTWRVVALTAVLWAGFQWMCLAVSDITQEGSKQVVKEKRLWAKSSGGFQKAPGQLLVLAFGNSKIGAGFYPEVFDAANGGKTVSYNLALIGLQLPPHYFLLKDFLKHNDAPDWLLVQYSPGGFEVDSFPSYAVQGAGFWEAVTYAWYKKNLDVLVNYLVPSRLHWPEVTRYFLGKALRLMPQKIRDFHKDLYLNRSNANAIYGHNRKHFYDSQYADPEKYRRDTLAGLRQGRGYYFIAEQAAEGGVISEEYMIRVGAKKVQPTLAALNEEQQVIDRINAAIAVDELPRPKQNAVPDDAPLPPFIDDFFQLTRRHHIKVMIIPNYSLSETGRDETALDPQVQAAPEIKHLQQKYDNVYVALRNRAPKVFGYQYFGDPGHANPAGAKRYSRIIGEEFKELREHLEN